MRVEHIHEDGKLVAWREWHRIDASKRTGGSVDMRLRNALCEIFDNRAIETGADAGPLTFNIIDRNNIEAGFCFVIPDGAQVFVPECVSS